MLLFFIAGGPRKKYFTALIIITTIVLTCASLYWRPHYQTEYTYVVENDLLSNMTSKNSLSEEETEYNKTLNSDYNSFDQSFIDLLPRSVYFDSRHRDGYDNATVILVQITKTAIKEKRIGGCAVDKHFNTADFEFKILDIFRSWVHHHYSSLTHDQARLTCYNLPAHQGSRVFVLYKDKTGKTLKIEAEKRLYFPVNAPSTQLSISQTANESSTSIMVCTTMFGKPTWLREWLVYQKTIGVDFIHIYAQESFITEGAVNNPVLQSYLKSGYAKLDVWKAYLDESQDYYHQQPLLYVDCIYRYRTEFDYVLLYDSDDFFVPVIPGQTDIHYYANRLFHNEKIACVNFKWIEYYPDCGLTTRPENIKDGNVTKHLAFNNHHARYLKSMYKCSGIVEIQIHDVVKFMPGYLRYGADPSKKVSGTPAPSDIAYVAHIRKNLKPKERNLRRQCEKRQREGGVYV